MKEQPIRQVGFDVHQSTVVASVRDEQGKVVMRATVPTEEKAPKLGSGSRISILAQHV